MWFFNIDVGWTSYPVMELVSGNERWNHLPDNKVVT
jgi:hypothetical protein